MLTQIIIHIFAAYNYTYHGYLKKIINLFIYNCEGILLLKNV